MHAHSAAARLPVSSRARRQAQVEDGVPHNVKLFAWLGLIALSWGCTATAVLGAVELVAAL